MTRALVLSGGGAVGIAWQTGLAAGLASEGVDLAEADFIVGTSAGSATGAQIALGRDLAHRIERYHGAASSGRPVAGTTSAGPTPRMQELVRLMTTVPPDERRAMIGKFALETETMPEEQFVQSFRYLDGEGWPRRYACTAVDAESGDFVVWDEAAGVDLVRAVASSCAVPGVFPPITINGKRYIDGGMRSATNADLAKGHDAVLIVTLMGGGRAPQMEQFRARFEGEVQQLRDAGAEVHMVAPDDESAASFGTNMLGSSTLPAAADAGLRQGKLEADRLRTVWS